MYKLLKSNNITGTIDLDVIPNLINKAYKNNTDEDINEISKYILDNKLKIINTNTSCNKFLKDIYNDILYDDIHDATYVHIKIIEQLLINMIIRNDMDSYDIIELFKLVNLELCAYCGWNNSVFLILTLAYNYFKVNLTEEFLYNILFINREYIYNDYNSTYYSAHNKFLGCAKYISLNNNKVNIKLLNTDECFTEKKRIFKIPYNFINFKVKDSEKMIYYCIFYNEIVLFNKLKNTIIINSDEIIYNIINSHLILCKYSAVIVKYLIYNFKYLLDLDRINILNSPKFNFNNSNIPSFNILLYDSKFLKFYKCDIVDKYRISKNINYLLKDYELSLAQIINLYKNEIIFDYRNIKLNELGIEKIYFEYYINIIINYYKMYKKNGSNSFAEYNKYIQLFLDINNNNKKILFREKFRTRNKEKIIETFKIDIYCVINDYISKEYKLTKHYNELHNFCEYTFNEKILYNIYVDSYSKTFTFLNKIVNDS